MSFDSQASGVYTIAATPFNPDRTPTAARPLDCLIDRPTVTFASRTIAMVDAC